MYLFWIEIILLIYFVYVALYTFIFALAGRLYRMPRIEGSQSTGKFAIFIPAYKEDGVIINVAKAALNQSFPATSYDVIVIADSLKDETLEKLRKLPIRVVEVSFEESTKVKALNCALKEVEKQYEYAVILDADNIMQEDFLSILNYLHSKGHRAIQARRAAKNKDTTLSLLDGLSEEINNHILGKGSTALGLSSALKGSGMSFEYDLLYHHLSKMESIGGFDRELELRLIENNIKVLYAHNAVVLDEKVSKSEVFENQRKRWISSQFIYLKKYFMSACKSLFTTANFTYFNSAVLRNIQLPRLINLGLIFILAVLAILVNPYLYFGYKIWVVTLAITYVSVLLCIPKEYIGKPLFLAIIGLPGIFLRMLLLLFKIKGANKKFIHTPHSS